jgi:tRNA (guanine-N7-)-methyltransferase
MPDNDKATASPAPTRALFGRRQGRGLRRGRRALLDEVLPRWRVSLPEGDGPLDPGTLFSPYFSTRLRRPAPPPGHPTKSYPVGGRAGERSGADSTIEVWLEIGFGAGEHLAADAHANPEIGLIGAEAYRDGIAALLGHIKRDGIGNIRVFPDDARLLLDKLAEGSLARVVLLFPDPWPKRRHHKRRFISAAMLDRLAFVLADKGELLFASDHDGYVRWTLEHVLAHPAFEWPVSGPQDWRTRPYPASTRYESKALRQGRRCAYLRFIRRARGEGPEPKLLEDSAISPL